MVTGHLTIPDGKPRIVQAGLVSNEDTWKCQRDINGGNGRRCRCGHRPALEHPPGYNAGKRTEARKRPRTSTPVTDVAGAGKITWYGVDHLAGYPILSEPVLHSFCYAERLYQQAITARGSALQAGQTGRVNE
jgi:lipoate-protein ligase B